MLNSAIAMYPITSGAASTASLRAANWQTTNQARSNSRTHARTHAHTYAAVSANAAKFQKFQKFEKFAAYVQSGSWRNIG